MSKSDLLDLLLNAKDAVGDLKSEAEEAEDHAQNARYQADDAEERIQAVIDALQGSGVEKDADDIAEEVAALAAAEVARFFEDRVEMLADAVAYTVSTAIKQALQDA